MADIYNVIRGDGVFFEGMTKEQIFELIAEMTGETVQDIDQAFITKLKEINKGNSIRLWLGTTAEYNGLSVKEDNVLYICTDDTFVPDTNLTLEQMMNKIDANTSAMNAKLEEQDEKIATNLAKGTFNDGASDVPFNDGNVWLEKLDVSHMRFLKNTVLQEFDNLGQARWLTFPSRNQLYYANFTLTVRENTDSGEKDTIKTYCGVYEGNTTISDFYTPTSNTVAVAFEGMYMRIS